MTLVGTGHELIQRRSLHNELVDRVRELITKGELASGQKIPEKDLCERFGVSRTPLREALKVLASEGIVTLTPHRGASVSALTVAEIEEVFPIIGALEALSGEIACSRITDAEVDAIRALHVKMVASWKAGQIQSYFRLNQSIHEAILDATRNETLKALYRSLSGRLFTARYTANMSEKRWARAVAEHEEILAALEERDATRLARVMRKHLANKLETVRDWLKHDMAD
jgi:DNA-binding GntR family transcriptional regulator